MNNFRMPTYWKPTSIASYLNQENSKIVYVISVPVEGVFHSYESNYLVEGWPIVFNCSTEGYLICKSKIDGIESTDYCCSSVIHYTFSIEVDSPIDIDMDTYIFPMNQYDREISNEDIYYILNILKKHRNGLELSYE